MSNRIRVLSDSPSHGGTVVGRRRTMTEQWARTHAIRAVQGDRQVVYAIRCRDGAIKIGCTSDLSARRRPLGDEILGFVFGDFEDEQAIHAQLVPYRARAHEYYHPTPEVMAVVNQMRDEFNLPHITR